jgi:Glycosyl hydrolase family 71
VAGTSVVPTTTLKALTTNNTSAATSFLTQTNGNTGAGNVSKTDVHSLLYAGANTKVYAHLMLWFGGTNHMNVGYSSTDSAQVHRQINDMISRGINGVVIDWYGTGSSNDIDKATKLVMAEAETHPGFTFAIMIDQGAIQWYSCKGCSPQQALVADLQYIEQTYFPSPAYMKWDGRPVVTNFNIDLSYSVDWNAASAALSTQPQFVFQNNDGFGHVLSDGSYSWVMPTQANYGLNYLDSFYTTGLSFGSEQTVGATYKGFNDTLAPWGSHRVMGQQCGQTWLQTFSELNSRFDSGKQLPALQLVTWNDYEEGTEIESGIDNCFSLTASVSGGSLKWSAKGDQSTIDHYVPYISVDGQNLMSLGNVYPGSSSINLCSFGFANGSYSAYVQAVGKSSFKNHISSKVQLTLSCKGGSTAGGGLTMATTPSSLDIASGGKGKVTVLLSPSVSSFDSAVDLSCSGLPSSWSCSFSPSSVTPGSVGASSELTVVASSIASTSNKQPSFFFAAGALGIGFFGLTLVGKWNDKRMVTVLSGCVAAILIVGSTSCGGSSISTVNTATNARPSNYVVTVNGNAANTQVSTSVAITVK